METHLFKQFGILQSCLVPRVRSSLCCLFCLFYVVQAFSEVPPLKFNNGHFKIVQLTDLHWIESESYQEKNDSTALLIREAVTIEHPDLVVITGDMVVSGNVREGWRKIAQIFEQAKTPFAVTFGNHDAETGMDLSQILEYISSFSYHRTYHSDPKISGVGNCVLPVFSSDGLSEKWMLYLFDSHNLTTDRTFGYYDWIKYDQIAWYRAKSDEVAKRNQRRLPSLAFFHIPLVEHETARWVCRELGEKHEGVCAPNVNSGLFAAFIEKKDVVGVFTGHDHNNDYLVDVNGNIALAYGRKTGFNAAYHEVLPRGCRVINLHEDDACFDTYIRDLNGTANHYCFEQKNNGTGVPSFSGSFIQEYLVKNWDRKRWNEEMKMLKEAGMKYLIYGPAFQIRQNGEASAIYPSSYVKRNRRNATLEKCLASARDNGVKIFIGLNFNDRWWKADFSAEWLLNEMEKGNRIADELVARYKARYPDTMYGWYWVWEVDNLHCMTPERQKVLAEALNTNLDHLTAIAPDMPLMLSPFMNYKVGGDAKAYGKMWENVFSLTRFRAGDIFAPQDCIGAGGLTLQNVDEWFSSLQKAVYTKPGLKFWANVEIFDQRFWISAPLERVREQLHLVNGYVSNMICFAYSHYYSPFVADAQYHDSYLQYRQTGELPKLPIPEKVIRAEVSRVKDGNRLTWVPGNYLSSKGYSIYRNGELLVKLQTGINIHPTEYVDKDGGADSQYEIAAYNVLGDESEKCTVKSNIR